MEKSGVLGKLLGAGAGAAGAGGCLFLLGGNAKELGELVEKAGVPFVVLLMLFWVLRPVAEKHKEFLDRTAATHEDMARSFQTLVEGRAADREILHEHTKLLTQICEETKRQTTKLTRPSEAA